MSKGNKLVNALGDYDSETKTFKEDEEVPLLAPSVQKITVWQKIIKFLKREPTYRARTVEFNQPLTEKYPPNVVRNQKYNPWTFIFVVLYEQFRFFFNLYFLIVALSQFIPPLQVGFLFTYISPLAFVLCVTIAKEAFDDIKRFLRDREANSQKYKKMTNEGLVEIPSSQIKVGDFVVVEKDQRVPTDLIFLRTHDKSGTCFIRTDQLDGETDWKLRRAVGITQKLPYDETLLSLQASLYAEEPKKDIYSFVGKFEKSGEGLSVNSEAEALSVENTLWANTVVASGRIIGVAVYTGRETRSVMNTSVPATKVGLLDLEINRLSKFLCIILLFLSFLMVALKGFQGIWYIYFFRFMLLFSAIIPISLRVNLDMAKTLYSFLMMRDKTIPGTVVRSSTIPEELGRIQYLLTDKTGTLTQNDMVFKKLHLGTVSFAQDGLEDIRTQLQHAYELDYQEEKQKKVKQQQQHLHESSNASTSSSFLTSSTTPQKKSIFALSSGTSAKVKRTACFKVRDAIRAIAICHNVTPVSNDDDDPKADLDIQIDIPPKPKSEKKEESSYQASSPDEIALVKFTESVNLTLIARDTNNMTLRNCLEHEEDYEILNVFPFTSETKRMGIIVRDKATDVIRFYVKGADSVMAKLVNYNEWLEEECDNLAREGLRTLVYGVRVMTEEEYAQFSQKIHDAKLSLHQRDLNVQKVIETIEHHLELVCLTGVEDKLQENVRHTLELLRNAGVRIWMLTGDKVETAKCIAISSKLVARSQGIFLLQSNDPLQARQKLDTFANLRDTCLIVDGSTLHVCLDNFKEYFCKVACAAPSVVCCRCSPTQKADIVRMIRTGNNSVTCAIGDGGNDVSMIQAAHVGVGIVGKEGKQASLAADFSINQFSYISPLLIWHGRNSYKRSARLGQFVIHRGLIISFIQAVFSALFYFAAISIYNGWLLVGYSTYYTTAPVFSLVFDEDLTSDVAFRFPELYKELQKGRALSFKTFFIWTFTSIYQGGVIMLLSLWLFDANMVNIVSITFSALIFTELLNVAFEIHKWKIVMVVSNVTTLGLYVASIYILQGYFNWNFVASWSFVWRVAVVTVVSCLPIFLWRFIKRRLYPPSYTKLLTV